MSGGLAGDQGIKASRHPGIKASLVANSRVERGCPTKLCGGRTRQKGIISNRISAYGIWTRSNAANAGPAARGRRAGSAASS